MLDRLLTRHPKVFMGCIVGAMTGSISKLWPWQVDAHLLGVNLQVKLSALPHAYSNITGHDPQIFAVMVAFFVGLLTLILLHFASKALTQDKG